jgi:hypothetical protein
MFFVLGDMAKMETIFVRLTTKDEFNAGTDGAVYIGIGGREFQIASQKNDFERGDDRTYIIGKSPAVLPDPNPTQNHWEFGFDYYHNYMIKTENLHLFPVYVRLDGGSRWHLEYIEIR